MRKLIFMTAIHGYKIGTTLLTLSAYLAYSDHYLLSTASVVIAGVVSFLRLVMGNTNVQ